MVVCNSIQKAIIVDTTDDTNALEYLMFLESQVK